MNDDKKNPELIIENIIFTALKMKKFNQDYKKYLSKLNEINFNPIVILDVLFKIMKKNSDDNIYLKQIIIEAIFNNASCSVIFSNFIGTTYLIENDYETISMLLEKIPELTDIKELIIENIKEKYPKDKSTNVKIASIFLGNLSNNYKLYREIFKNNPKIFDVFLYKIYRYIISNDIEESKKIELIENVLLKEKEYYSFPWQYVLVGPKNITLLSKTNIVQRLDTSGMQLILEYSISTTPDKKSIFIALQNLILNTNNQNNKSALINLLYRSLKNINDPYAKNFINSRFFQNEYNTFRKKYDSKKEIINIINGLQHGHISENFYLFKDELLESPEFKQNFDSILQNIFFVNRDVIEPELAQLIITALCNRFCQENNMNVKTNFGVVGFRNLGHYDFNSKSISIDLSEFVKNNDKYSLIKCIYVMLHELTHAKQQQKEWGNSNNRSYNMLLQVLDHINRENFDNNGRNINYYSLNYSVISYEIDARAQSYVEIMAFIRKYCPEYEERLKNEFYEDFKATYEKQRGLRRIQQNPKEEKYSIVNAVHLFLLNPIDPEFDETNNQSIESRKKGMLKTLQKYPILNTIFYYDDKTNKICIKNQIELLRMKETFQKNNDKEGAQLIDDVIYDIIIFQKLLAKKDQLNPMTPKQTQDEISNVVEELSGPRQ